MLKLVGLGVGLMMVASVGGEAWVVIMVGLGLMMFYGTFMMSWGWEFYSLCGFDLGVDVWGAGLGLLTIWVVYLILGASVGVKSGGDYSKEFGWLLVFMLLLLMLSFYSLSLVQFYVLFEGSLIPVFMMILGWGYQPERVQAGLYLMLYTLGASLPLLVSVMWLVSGGSSYFCEMEEVQGLLLYYGLIMAFLVKMPMFFFHLWLPSAHVEAPVGGSMILAGILLKLGGYGLMRVMGKIGMYGGMGSFWLSMGVFGGAITSMICVRQVDMKSLVAYSSVGHMGMVLGGLFSLNFMGYKGGYVLMIAHGLCSSGLFCLVNMLYERLGSRSMIIGSGLGEVMPSFSLWWFLLCVCNMAAPPSLNLGGEFMLICSMMGWSYYIVVGLCMLLFLSGVYSLYLYSYSQHGKYSGRFSFYGLSSREYLLMVGHWAPLNFLVLKMDLVVGS